MAGTMRMSRKPYSCRTATPKGASITVGRTCSRAGYYTRRMVKTLAAEDSVLDVLAGALGNMEDIEELRPRHVSAESLDDLKNVISSYKDVCAVARNVCTNCMAPRERDQTVCTFCGHDSTRDRELLGHCGEWQLPPAMLLPMPSETQTLTPSEQDGVAASAHGPDPSHAASTRAVSPTSVAFAVDEGMLLHRTTLPPYPERPERLQAIVARLSSSGLTQRCSLVPSREASDEELLAVHSQELVSALASAAGPGSALSSEDLLPVLDPGMLIGEHTNRAARLAAGAATDVAMAVATGKVANGVAVVRPPGHHASRDLAHGGCYFNNVAVAARALQSAGAARRVMIVDWDIHYGQGTQQIFDQDDSVLYLSLHREDGDFYPRETSGDVSVVGSQGGAGHSINVAWAEHGISDGDYLAAFMHVVMPIAYSFAPDVILVSAGFGAADGDFQGGCSVSPACYAHMTHILKAVAPLALVLEGGFNLDQTARCMESCVRVLLGERPPPLPTKMSTTPAGWVAVMNVMQVHAQSWPALKPLSLNGWMEVLKRQQQKAEQAGEGELEYYEEVEGQE